MKEGEKDRKVMLLWSCKSREGKKLCPKLFNLLDWFLDIPTRIWMF